MTAAERKYEEGRRAGLLEAASALEARAAAGHSPLFREAGRLVRALAGPVQARLDGGEKEGAGLAEFIYEHSLCARRTCFAELERRYEAPGPATRAETLKKIRARLRQFKEERLTQAQALARSKVLAAGVGMYYSGWHRGENEKHRVWLEVDRPFRNYATVEQFAELCFERRREVAGG